MSNAIGTKSGDMPRRQIIKSFVEGDGEKEERMCKLPVIKTAMGMDSTV